MDAWRLGRGSSVNDQPTTTSPRTSNHDGADGQSICVVGCKKLRANLSRRACGDACEADRINAIAAEKVKSLALDYAGQYAHGTQLATDAAWDELAAAVDELVSGKC